MRSSQSVPPCQNCNSTMVSPELLGTKEVEKSHALGNGGSAADPRGRHLGTHGSSAHRGSTTISAGPAPLTLRDSQAAEPVELALVALPVQRSEALVERIERNPHMLGLIHRKRSNGHQIAKG